MAYPEDKEAEEVRAALPPEGMAIRPESMMALATRAAHVQVRTLAGSQMLAEKMPSDGEAIDILQGILGPGNAPLTMAEITPTIAQRLFNAVAGENEHDEMAS